MSEYEFVDYAKQYADGRISIGEFLSLVASYQLSHESQALADSLEYDE